MASQSETVAVDDGATVPIYYESRLAKLNINEAEMETLNDEVDEVIEDEEDVAARESTKSKWAALEKLVGSEPRIALVGNDLVEHFENRIATMPGKAMAVCMSREICVDLYDAIVAIRPDWHDHDPMKGAIKIVMTGAASDKEKLQPHIYNKETKKLKYTLKEKFIQIEETGGNFKEEPYYIDGDTLIFQSIKNGEIIKKKYLRQKLAL